MRSAPVGGLAST